MGFKCQANYLLGFLCMLFIVSLDFKNKSNFLNTFFMTFYSFSTPHDAKLRFPSVLINALIFKRIILK